MKEFFVILLHFLYNKTIVVIILFLLNYDVLVKNFQLKSLLMLYKKYIILKALESHQLCLKSLLSPNPHYCPICA